MIDIKDIGLSFGNRDIFRGACLRLEDTERVALFGINGSGKSTLLKIVAGLQRPDTGEVALGRGDNIGYLPQSAAEETEGDETTVFDFACKAFAGLHAAHARCEELEHRMADGSVTDSEMEEYGHLHDRLAVGGGWSFESQARQVLSGLGFAQEAQDRPLATFSGGWRMRAALARVLLARPTVLLLDEPTNHLDLESILWLEDHIKGMAASVIFISHDRTFVDRLAHRIAELELGKIRSWPIPYDRFQAEKKQYLDVLKASYVRQQQEIAEAERFIARFKATSTKSAQAMSRQKKLDKIERIEIPPEVASVRLRFPDPPESGAYPFILREAGKAYGDKVILSGVNLSIRRGERVAIVGQNGAGKSTLMHLLAGTFPPTSGHVDSGHKTDVGLFAQYDDLPEDEQDMAIEDLVANHYPGTSRTKVRTILGSLLFSGEDAEKHYRVLSGGERARVRMALLLLRPHNVLLLDEPTNHLDLTTREIILNALEDWGGTVLFVSHDRRFTRDLAGRILAVGGGKVVDWPGTYDEFLASTLGQEKASSEKTGAIRTETVTKAPVEAKPVVAETPRSAAPVEEKAPLSREAQKEERRRRKRVEELEARITELEAEVARLDETMGAPGFFNDPEASSQALARRERLMKEHESAWAEFETLEAAG